MRTYKQVARSVYGETRMPFWSGFSGVLNLFGNPNKSIASRRRLRSETEALNEDWANVSSDLQRAFRQAGRQAGCR